MFDDSVSRDLPPSAPFSLGSTLDVVGERGFEPPTPSKRPPPMARLEEVVNIQDFATDFALLTIAACDRIAAGSPWLCIDIDKS